MTDQLEGQMSLLDLDIWSGKTYQEPSVQTVAKTSKPSSRKSSGSQNQMLPMCLCLLKGNGISQDVSTERWVTGRLLGEYTMHSFGEQPHTLMEECCFPALPSGVSVSRLSQILEACPLPKYALSGKACAGILRRAEKRGKELPEQLKVALERQAEVMPTLQAAAGESGNNKPMVCYGISGFNSGAMLSDNPKSGIYEADTSRTLDLNGGNPACNQGGVVVLESNGSRPSHKGDGYAESDVMYTLNSTEHHAGVNTYSLQRSDEHKESDKSHTLSARDYKDATDLVVQTDVYGMRLDNCSASPYTGQDISPTIRQGAGPNGCANVGVYAAVDCRNGTENTNTNGTLQAKSTGGISINYQNVCRVNSTVRRLTPGECELLQGFPKNWTNIGEWTDSKGKKHKDSDSPRYKALGNSIAIPFWFWLLRRISAQYERPATLGSLFDGIGGFPLCWERCNGQGTAIWASEIEEFPIAVTKRRFPEPYTEVEEE